MKNKIWITVGLQASGKTFWANKKVDEGQGKIININKDDLRSMLHNNKHSKSRESLVIKMQESMILTALDEDKDIIISDTNLNSVHIDRIKNIFSSRAEIIIEDSFLQVTLEECISRDKNRIKSVGENVIRATYNKWIRKEESPNLIPWDHSKKTACVFDIDGTLTYGPNNRSPFEWAKVGQDLVRQPVKDLLKIHYFDNTIIIVSGRDECCRKETETWLKDNDIPYHSLFMRQTEDNRPDEIIKEEIIDSKILPFYNIKIWVDDRLKVCRMLHKKGIPLFRVGDPDSDF